MRAATSSTSSGSVPYRVWHHEHHFTEVPGGIHMRDIVHYSVPFGPLGDLIERAVIGRRVEAIFEFRRGVLDQRFGRPAVAS